LKYPFPVYDAHNHLQDERLASQLGSIVESIESIPVQKTVVNGTQESDWDSVAALAAKYDWVIPSVGLHPWYVNHKSENWEKNFAALLDARPAAAREDALSTRSRFAVGEIGLDRWIENHDFPAQQEVFRIQLRHAAKRNLPVSIHCLQAWGPMLETLQKEKLPECGFLLHSYGGSAEMVKEFADLGGYFSLSGYFAHERKARQREVFRHVPMDRLLLETDAPDMTPPSSHVLHFLSDSQGAELNHPANIPAVYEFAAELYSVPMEELASIVETNFWRVFGQFCAPKVGTDR
jgi:TatD DNase family protein